MSAARKAGATGATIINNARGEGLEIGRAGHFDDKPGTGIAVQIEVEDTLDVSHQIQKITSEMDDLLSCPEKSLAS